MPLDSSASLPKFSNSVEKLKLNRCDTVHIVKFSPFVWSSNLLAVATYSKIVIYTCNLNRQQTSRGDDSTTSTEPEFKCLAEINLPSGAVDISWSPEANLNEIPQVIKLFVADSDHSIRNVESHVRHQSAVSSGALTVIGKHSDHINAVSAHPCDGLHVASVSDDLTLCVWTLESSQQGSGESRKLMSVPLTSPGMSVCWHPAEAKILVGEKQGVIRVYALDTQQALLSLDCMRGPLRSVDWCTTNPLHVVALVQGEWFLFDTSVSQLPVAQHSAHSGSGRSVLWCRSHEHLIATSGRPAVELRVFNIHSAQAVLSLDMKVSSGMSWHAQYPILCIGVDNEVQFWTIDTHL